MEATDYGDQPSQQLPKVSKVKLRRCDTAVNRACIAPQRVGEFHICEAVPDPAGAMSNSCHDA